MVAQPHSYGASGTQTILIVEDEAISRHALAALLRLSGYPTWAVGSAEEAVRIMDRGVHPDVAIIDLDLPGMDGMALADYLEKHDPTVRPMLITAADLERLEKLLDDHPLPCLRKPFEFSELLAMLADKRDRVTH